MYKRGSDPYSGLQAVHKNGSTEGLQIEQPGLLPVEKRQPMYNLQIAETSQPKPRLMFGVRPPTFWLSAALLVATLAAIGLAAGLGVSQMDRAKEQRNILNIQKLNDTQGCSGVTVPANSTITLKPTTDCPGSNGQFITTDGENKYQKFCNATLGGWYDEVTNTEVDSFNSCIVLCANINYNLNRTDVSAMYNAYGTNQYKPGYCLCATSEQKGQAQVSTDSETDLAFLVKES